LVNQYTAKKIPPGEQLKYLYYKCKYTQQEIGNIFDTTQKVVYRWFKVMNISARIPKKRDQYGNNNDSWKGDNAGIAAFHKRLKNERGIADHCELCNKGVHFEWANLTGNYKDINDYKMMCKSCHAKYDHVEKNFKAGDVQ